MRPRRRVDAGRHVPPVDEVAVIQRLDGIRQHPGGTPRGEHRRADAQRQRHRTRRVVRERRRQQDRLDDRAPGRRQPEERLDRRLVRVTRIDDDEPALAPRRTRSPPARGSRPPRGAGPARCPVGARPRRAARRARPAPGGDGHRRGRGRRRAAGAWCWWAATGRCGLSALASSAARGVIHSWAATSWSSSDDSCAARERRPRRTARRSGA